MTVLRFDIVIGPFAGPGEDRTMPERVLVMTTDERLSAARAIDGAATKLKIAVKMMNLSGRVNRTARVAMSII